MTSVAKRNFHARISVFFFFLFAGSAVTIWAVNIPEVENRLNLSHTQLGALLVCVGLGALFSCLLYTSDAADDCMPV
jgi:hypothetical protein